MNKIISVFLVLFALSCGTTKSVPDSTQNPYYPTKGVNAKFKYVQSDDYIYHRDLDKTEVINGKTYTVRQIEYSWGKKVETKYRVENGNVLFYDADSQTEEMIMPKNPQLGQKWKNTSQSWEYEIIDLNASIEVPNKKYSGLLLLKATQLTNSSPNKFTSYLIYYQKGVGKIASIGDDKLIDYRIEF